MKKLVLIFVIFFLSIFLVGTQQAREQIPQKYTVQMQDTIKINAMVKNPNAILKISSSQKREMEFQEWQKRSQKMDKNFEALDRQSAVMDSLLGKKKIDTVQVIK